MVSVKLNTLKDKENLWTHLVDKNTRTWLTILHVVISYLYIFYVHHI